MRYKGVKRKKKLQRIARIASEIDRFFRCLRNDLFLNNTVFVASFRNFYGAGDANGF